MRIPGEITRESSAEPAGGALAPPLRSLTAHSVNEISIRQFLAKVMTQHRIHARHKILCACSSLELTKRFRRELVKRLHDVTF